MAIVFISYSREAQEKTRALAQDLGALGHDAWFDQELTGGQVWWDKIVSEIQKCDLFVFTLSSDSLGSEACRHEYMYAVKLGKCILPVLVTDGVSIELLPPALAQTHYVDYRREDKESLAPILK